MKMLMKIDPPTMRESLVMAKASFPTLGGKFPRQNCSTEVVDCFCPGSASRRRRFVTKASLLFFLGQNLSYNRRWTLGAGQGGHKLGRRTMGGRVRPLGLWQPSGSLSVISSPNLFIYSKKILHKVSGHLELGRIGISDLLLSSPEFQLPAFSLFM